MNKNTKDLGDYIFFFIVGIVICALLCVIF